MDLLSINHILIDCNQKKVVFPEEPKLSLLSTQQVSSELKGGTQCFVILTCMEEKDEDHKKFISNIVPEAALVSIALHIK